jgi:hypothetical protein
MWPTFELYNSMMNGSWLLWMERHPQTVRLQRLLNTVHPVAGCQPELFFREFLLLLDSSCHPAMQRLRCEVIHMALHSHTAGGICDGSFLQLPAYGYRQQFLHLLTGFTLRGYDQWMKRIADSAQGDHCRMYFRRRMMEKLESFIEIRTGHVEPSHREPQMVYLVKTALCVLYTWLTGGGIHAAPGFCPRERLQQQLCESGLPEATCTRLMLLYDKLTLLPEPLSAVPAAPQFAAIPPVMADSSLQPPPVVTEAELAKLLAELKTGFDAVKQGLETTLKGGMPPAGNTGQETDIWLDPREVREMLGVSKASMNRYRRNGQLPYSCIGGKFMYREADVNKLRKNHSK